MGLPKCFLFLLPDYCIVLCLFGTFFSRFNPSNSASKKNKCRTQQEVNKAEKMPEHINFSNSGGLSIFFYDCLRELYISSIHCQHFRNL